MSDPNDNTNTPPTQEAGFRLNPAALDKVGPIQEELEGLVVHWVPVSSFRERMLHGVMEHLAARLLEASLIAVLGAGLVLLWGNTQTPKPPSLPQPDRECADVLVIPAPKDPAQPPHRPRLLTPVSCPQAGDTFRIRLTGNLAREPAEHGE